MKIFKSRLGAFFTELTEHLDERGSFCRLFCSEEFGEVLGGKTITQINLSKNSFAGTIRGMHCQLPPQEELKIIACLSGMVFDVIVDLRKGSSTFLEWESFVLSASDKKMVVVPEGFAHGFQTMADQSELIYFHTGFYCPEHEFGISYKEPKVAVKWPLTPTNVSAKDSRYAFLIDGFGGFDF